MNAEALSSSPSPALALESGTKRSSLPPASLICPLVSILDPLDLPRLFSQPQPLEVELGSGDGSFLAQWAAQHPQHNFIGVERLLGRLRKLDRKGRRAELVNLRLFRLEAAYFLEYLLPPASVHALHLYFPDPWPKRKHRPRRLVNGPFTGVAARALQPGGWVFLRTDDADYFAQMTGVFADNPAFQASTTPARLSAVITDFERDYQAQGKTILRAAYQRTHPL